MVAAKAPTANSTNGRNNAVIPDLVMVITVLIVLRILKNETIKTVADNSVIHDLAMLLKELCCPPGFQPDP